MMEYFGRAVTTCSRTLSNPCRRPRRCGSGTARCPSPTVPSPETREQLGGFILIDARDLDDAIRVASEIPPARLGSVEVRPVWELKQP